MFKALRTGISYWDACQIVFIGPSHSVVHSFDLIIDIGVLFSWEGIQQLREMFPDQSPVLLQQLVAQHGVEHSISYLLRENENVQQSSSSQILPLCNLNSDLPPDAPLE